MLAVEEKYVLSGYRAWRCGADLGRVASPLAKWSQRACSRGDSSALHFSASGGFKLSPASNFDVPGTGNAPGAGTCCARAEGRHL
jgi:hypothetical protein